MSCIAVDLGGVFAHLDDVARRQIPFAAKNTVNKLAANVIEAEQAEMASVFGNPRQWTLNSLFVRQYADKHNLTAIVDLKTVRQIEAPESICKRKFTAARAKRKV